jgi:hypothetical protein
MLTAFGHVSVWWVQTTITLVRILAQEQLDQLQAVGEICLCSRPDDENDLIHLNEHIFAINEHQQLFVLVLPSIFWSIN